MSAQRSLPINGKPSPRFGHLGVWIFSLGPHSPVPGERLELAVLDETGAVIRRMEQIRGRCTDPGYVDFFLSHNCRPSAHEYPIVDIGADGKLSAILCQHYAQSMGMNLYLELLTKWATTHGKPEYAL